MEEELNQRVARLEQAITGMEERIVAKLDD